MREERCWLSGDRWARQSRLAVSQNKQCLDAGEEISRKRNQKHYLIQKYGNHSMPRMRQVNQHRGSGVPSLRSSDARQNMILRRWLFLSLVSFTALSCFGTSLSFVGSGSFSIVGNTVVLQADKILNNEFS